MRQTDNKEILIRLLSNYEKELDKINSYRSFKRFKVEKAQLILFIDNWQKSQYNDKYLFTNIAYKSRKRIIYQTCFWLCIGICFLAAMWELSHYPSKSGGQHMSKTLHPISYSIGYKLNLISAIAAVVTYLVYKIDNKIYQKELATKISFDTYKNHIRYIKYKLKEIPWQEVNAILKKMEDDGVEFPKGYNFNVQVVTVIKIAHT